MIGYLRLACIPSLCALIVAPLVSGVAVAQASQARIVQAGDGTVRLVENNDVWTVVPDQADDAAISALTMGGPIGASLPQGLGSTDLAPLATFNGMVLLPSPLQQPFSNMPVTAVSADATAYSVEFRSGPAVWSIQGDATHTTYDEWNNNCPGTTPYCTFADGTQGSKLTGEVFRGLNAPGPTSVALHLPAPTGVDVPAGTYGWGVTWLSKDSPASYSLRLFGTADAAFGAGLSPNNRSGANQLATLASALVQSSSDKARIVLGSDGSLYLTIRNYAWTIVPDAIGDGELGTLNKRGEIDGIIPPFLTNASGGN